MADPVRMSPLTRAALRLPRRLYAHGLGPLLGNRFLRLTHTGRVTGRTHTTVLEVVARDRGTGEYIVVSGFGPRADWLRNVRAGGPVEITVGRRQLPARPRELDAAEAEAVFADYERRNRLARPILHAVLSRLLGWKYRGLRSRAARAVVCPLRVRMRPCSLYSMALAMLSRVRARSFGDTLGQIASNFGSFTPLQS